MATGSAPTLQAFGDDVIVWEYEADIPGLYSPYTDNVSNFIEKKYQNKEKIVRLGQIDSKFQPFQIDFNKMEQLNQFGPGRKIQRKIYSCKTVLGKGMTWQWLTDFDWVVYDGEALEALEKAYLGQENVLDLGTLSFVLPNKVLLDKMYQVNKITGFVRPVRREKSAYNSASRKKASPKKMGKTHYRHRIISAGLKVQSSSLKDVASSTIPKRKRTNDVSKSSRSRDMGSVNISKSQSVNQASSSKSVTVDPSLTNFFIIASQVKEDDECPICLCPYIGDDAPDDECPICLCPYIGDDAPDDAVALELKKCKHKLHQTCAIQYAKSQTSQTNTFLQCPSCKTIHGEKRGNQPPGRMGVRIDRHHSVDGYPGCGMIIITYSFSGGIQGTNHPNPNRRYYANSFPRRAYLPANEKGTKVLKMLEVAWKRNLIFTIGTSVTTGQDDCIVWNEIHHKTSPYNDLSGHGYPDPNYLDNVITELKQHGVTEHDI